MPSLPVTFSSLSLSTVYVSVDIDWGQLYDLNPSKSSGLDGCHPRVFKEVKEGLLQPLFLLLNFKKSLETGQLLRPWK